MFLIVSGIGFSLNILYLPLIMITQYIVLLGIVLITSSIDVYVRDAEYIVNFIMQMVFYATPILYPMQMFPEWIQKFLRLNPMVTIIESYRNILYFQTAPNFKYLSFVFIGGIILLFIGFKIFYKLEKGFAEEL